MTHQVCRNNEYKRNNAGKRRWFSKRKKATETRGVYHAPGAYYGRRLLENSPPEAIQKTQRLDVRIECVAELRESLIEVLPVPSSCLFVRRTSVSCCIKPAPTHQTSTFFPMEAPACLLRTQLCFCPTPTWCVTSTPGRLIPLLL